MTTPKQNTMAPKTAPAFVGIDLAKNSVHVHGVDGSCRTCSDQKLKPAKLKTFLTTLKPCVVGMEACGRAHQWGRGVLAMGHDAKLMAPQFVTPSEGQHKRSG